MDYVPPWSQYTLSGRGKLVLLSVDLSELVEDELAIADSRHDIQNIFRRALTPRRNLALTTQDDTMSDAESEGSAASDDNGEGDSEADEAASALLLPSAELDSDSEDEADFDYIPSAECFIEYSDPPVLRPRAPPSPSGSIGLSPVPDLLTTTQMQALGFRLVKGDECVFHRLFSPKETNFISAKGRARS